MGIVSVLSLVVYLLALMGLAFWARSKSSGNAESYYLADRKIGVFALTATIVATAVNGLAITGTPALFHTGGILYSQMFVVALVTTILIWTFGPQIAETGRNQAIITQAEYFGHHYKSRPVQVFTACLGLMSLIPFLAAQIVGVGKILVGVSGGQIPFELGITVCVVAIALYVFLGGARAVVATDILQGAIFFVFLIVAAYVLMERVGGVSEVLARLPKQMPEKLSFTTATLSAFIDNCLSWSFAFFLWPHMFQRMFMADNGAKIRLVASLSFLTNTVIVLCILAMAMAATVHFAKTPIDPNQLIAAMLSTVWPVGGIILVVVIFALAMSTIDSIILTSGSIISRDFSTSSDGKRGQLSRLFDPRFLTLMIVVLAIAIAISEFGRFNIVPLVTMSAAIATLALWPLVGTLWSKPRASAVLATQSLGFLTIVYIHFSGQRFFELLGAASSGFVVAGLTFVLVSMASSRNLETH